MFDQILGLMLALLLLLFANESPSIPSFTYNSLWALFLYPFVLWCSYQQGKRWRDSALYIVQAELLVFLAYLFLYLRIHLFFHDWPLSNTATLLFGLLLYSFGWWTYQLGSSSCRESCRQMALLLPLAAPFLVISCLLEAVPWVSVGYDTLLLPLIPVLLIVFSPPLLIRLWRASPVSSTSLSSLEAVCSLLRFRHGGLLVWHAMGRGANAAILGLLPCWRYILISPGLMAYLPVDELSAIIAHEIAHSQRHHLLFYPYIFIGMMFSGFWVMEKASFLWGIENLYLLFALFAITAAIYYRYLFGYFSRLFEREADLYVTHAGIPLQVMASALRIVGEKTALDLEEPNWHHGSLGSRIRFLLSADSSAEKRQRRHIFCAMMTYTAFLIFLLCDLSIL